MQEIWDRIEASLGIYAPEMLNGLAEGASEEDIQQLEIELGYHLPEPLRDSLRIHNGAGDFVDAWELLDLRSILHEHQEQREILHWLQETDDKPDWWWRPHWIPLAKSGGGDLLCVDVTPEGNTPVGQIILFDHEVGSGPIASSFHTFLSSLADHLEAGKYAIDEWGTLSGRVPWEKHFL